MQAIENDDQAAGAVAHLRSQFLTTLLSKRKEAIQGRIGSGIEKDWTEDEEHYQGIDDANRRFHSSQQKGPLLKRWAEASVSPADEALGRSVVFVNITRPYVDAASARVADMLLPTDDRAWEIRPTPIPKFAVDQVVMAGAEAELLQLRDVAAAAAKAMQDQVDDHLVESGWHGEVRKVIEDSARLGSGVLKGPFPVRVSSRLTKRNELGQVEFIKKTGIRPGSKRIDPWNFYPDPACGDCLHNGSYTWEREFISRRQLKDMLDMPGYDTAEIVRAIKDGPSLLTTDGVSTSRTGMSVDGQYEMWIFHGHADVEHLMALGVEGIDLDGLDPEEDRLPAMAVMVNDRLVKVTLSALDSGDFPYDILAWQARPGQPWGTGVARHIRTAQRMLNGGARAMMDNSGLTAAPQIIIGNGVTPEDGRFTLYGGKIWRAAPDTGNMDARAALSAFHVPSVQAELQGIINFALKMAEDTTGMPQMLQGIRGDAPDTLGGMQMANNNATSVLRRLAKRFDDFMTAPHIHRYFDWMMQFSDDDSIKGDFQIQVRASSALVERDAQQHFMLQMASFARDPQYGINPAKLIAELSKGQRLDPRRFQYSEEEMQQRAEQQSQAAPSELAKAKLLEAQAGKAEAETGKVQAQTATTNVEGFFSATQAALNIAANPLIAPPADAMWRSAGGKDADPGPAIPEAVAPGSQLPERNTNPLTPANPQPPIHPDEGMNTGIEGGQP